jgi:hypothetical protein
MTTKSSWRDVWKIHPAAELFPLLSGDELRELGEDIKANGLTSPIILWSDGKSPAVLLDGRNRLDAIEIAIRKPVEIGPPSLMAGETFLAADKVIVLGKSVDPYLYVVSANFHRRHLTAEQKRDFIEKLIKERPHESNRRLAKALGVSHPHLAKVRAEMEQAGDVETLPRLIDTKGRHQPAKKKATPAPKKRPRAKAAANEKAKPSLAEKLDPLLEALFIEGQKNYVTIAPTVVADAAIKLERLLVEYGIMPKSRRSEDPQGYVRLLKQRAARRADGSADRRGE